MRAGSQLLESHAGDLGIIVFVGDQPKARPAVPF